MGWSAGISIDYLVNNAGAAGPDLLHDRDWDVHLDYIRLVMTSVAHLCHLLIPPMAERGYGRVINVASVSGMIPMPTGGTGAFHGPSPATSGH